MADLDRPANLAKRFLDVGSGERRYAIGRNDDTLKLHELIGLQGLIDDFSLHPSTWHGIPIVRTQDVPQDSLVANCSTSISPVSVLKHLDASGLRHVVGLHELASASDGNFPWPEFVLSQRAEMKEHLHEWTKIYEALSDKESRQTFLDVVRFRLSSNPHYMKEYEVRIQHQYFEDFMKYRSEVFIDAGGFDGDTTQEFADRFPDYRKIILFEPSKINMDAARKRLADYRDIEYRQMGLSDVEGTLFFNQDGGSAASVVQMQGSRGTKIPVSTLDTAVLEPVTFIKMDLEGWEMKALEGSRGHITRDRPKLAIAVYHNASDFRLVFQFVEALNHKYDCYLRHYTQGWSETVMFFV